MNAYKRTPDAEFYSVRFELKGKAYLRATRATSIEQALKVGRKLRNDLLAENFGFVEASKLRNDLATLGEIIERYETRTKEAGKLQASTVKHNVNAFGHLVREGLGLPRGADISKLSGSVLTAKLMADFVSSRLKGAKTAAAKARAAVTINSYRRFACSLFTRHARRHFYDDLPLPDLTGFLDWEKEKEPDHHFRPVPAERVADMEGAAEALRKQHPALWAAWALMYRMGLRNKEVAAARWDWVSRDSEGWLMAVENRLAEGEDFKPKGEEGTVGMADDLYAKLQELKDKSGYIVPAKHATERWNLAHRELNRFVRRFITGRVKGAYELRKLAGSVALTRYGLPAAQRMMRHKSSATTEAHYATYLGQLPRL